MKTVSQLNAQGYFTGPVIADESPLEPGVYLLPGGAIDVPPPTVPAGKVALRQGSSWVFVLPPESPETPPPVAGVPQSVTRFQALAALHLAGHLPAVQAIMAAPETPVLAKLAWDNALSFERSSPLLNGLAGTLGLTSQDLDDLFTAAAGIAA